MHSSNILHLYHVTNAWDRNFLYSSLTQPRSALSLFFFFNDTATTEIYTLSLHDALPISFQKDFQVLTGLAHDKARPHGDGRSEEHTSELQSRSDLVCRLLLEKKKNIFSRSFHE